LRTIGEKNQQIINDIIQAGGHLEDDPNTREEE
jgi:hypothetical protein